MNDNRKKLTGILKLLYENTDADHYMDTYQIMDALEYMGYGRPDRKTIDANIKFIIEELGFGVRKDKGKPNRYRWAEREFDLSELKMLADAVSSSRFITARKTRELISKLKTLTSNHQAGTLNRELYTSGVFKRDGSEALKNSDIISDAIRNRYRVGFFMVDYDMDKQEVPRHGGRIHEVSPYAILWNNDYWYMVGMDAESSEIRSYRIDRMKDIGIIYLEAAPKPKDFDISRYSSCVFDMFTGETADVVLVCRDYTMNYLIDRFGRDFYSEQIAEDKFSARVTVDASPTFYAWVFQFGGDIRIAEPASVRNGYEAMLKANLQTRL